MEQSGNLIEADLELNEMNFNLIKNSKAFKPMINSKTQHYDEIFGSTNSNNGLQNKFLKVGNSNFNYKNVRRSEEDRNSWIQ